MVRSHGWSPPLKAVATVEDYRQALYREAHLALRGVIGTRELDVLLSNKDAVARELVGIVRARVAGFGIEVVALGIRDVILPGEMKDLMNKVTEAKKAAEAALITRREETAAMRSQANTAKIIESSPTLMRLRELEVLEKVSEKANLTVVLGAGEGGSRAVPAEAKQPSDAASAYIPWSSVLSLRARAARAVAFLEQGVDVLRLRS